VIRGVFRASLSVVAALAFLDSFAYNPPTDSAAGVFVSIEGFDQAQCDPGDWSKPGKLGCVEIDASKPLEIPVVVSNATDAAVKGVLSVWMNDDWTVGGVRREEIGLSVAPGKARRVVRTAAAGARVLPALYPIHALFSAQSGASPHAIAIVQAETGNRAFAALPAPDRSVLTSGAYRLDSHFACRVSAVVGGKEVKYADPDKNDPEWGGHFYRTGSFGYTGIPGDRRCGFACHPPYKKGHGDVFCDFDFTIAAGNTCVVRFSNALQVTAKGGNPGDGVRMRVLVREEGAADFREVFSREISECGKWIDGSADISSCAGKRVTLRLAVDSGARGNTGYDGCAWGDPTIEVGMPLEPRSESEWARMEREAEAKAVRAIKRGTSDAAAGEYILSGDGESCGAGFVPGVGGLIDGVIAFSDGRSSVAYRGFECEVDGEKMHSLAGREFLRCDISAEKCALVISWKAAGTSNGQRRFTRLAVGPANRRVERMYGGFGWVFENPVNIRMDASGFNLSTRHAGADYEGGLSVVQALDVPPVAFVVDSKRRISSLVGKNDSVFRFIPSSRGAFAAAKRFAAISGYRASPGYGRLCGKTCIDNWSSDCAGAAKGLSILAKYGLGGSLYVHHNWQRWGYDYRLPDIYPPRDDSAAFLSLAAKAKSLGFIFAPHDNYVDFYPDADEYSYDSLCFNADGTPLKAWYNPSRRAQSYRWLPQAIHPFVRRNMALMRDGFGPDGLFIDVFTASMPRDCIDREGRFYSAECNAVEWRKAFDECREALGRRDAIMVSEAGHDLLIGHIDAGEADHFMPERLASSNQYSACERVPWHDVASHNKMILLGGGLGGRYSQYNWTDKGDNELHGYGSDDYFCTTVIGGRSPMTGLDMRIGVRTHWLLGDICPALAAGSFDGFRFVDGIKRQHASFSTGEVWVNRSGSPWKAPCGCTLPTYGFFAKTKDAEAGVVERDGIRCAFSKRSGCWFVDARRRPGPAAPSPYTVSVSGCDKLGPGNLRIRLEWRLSAPIPSDQRPFVHWVGKDGKIAFQSSIDGFPPEVRAKVGVWTGANLPV